MKYLLPKILFFAALFLITISLLFSFLGLVFNQPVQAQVQGEGSSGEEKGGLVPCGREGTPDCEICHLFLLSRNVINFVLFEVVPPVGAGLFLISGVMFMLSGANEKLRGQAKTWFRNVFWGVIIIYVSFIIIMQVITILAPSGKETFFSITDGGFSFTCPVEQPVR